MRISENKEIKSILVIRLSSMGDVILTTEFVRQLTKRFPQTRIDFLTADTFSEIYKFSPYLNKVIEYDKKASSSLIKALKTETASDIPGGKYDIIIDLQRNFRSAIFRRGLGRQILKVYKNRLNKFLLVKFKKNRYKEVVPIADIYRRTAESVGVEDDNFGLEIRLSSEKDLDIYPPFNRVSASSENLTVGIAPAANHKTKRLPTATYIEIIILMSEKYNCKFVFFGGPGDEPTVSKITEGLAADYQDFSGTKSILKTSVEIDKCDLLITNDTGVLHIGAARAVPTVAIFGSTVPEFGFAPRRTAHRIVQKDLKCRPCTHIGRAECPQKHFDCMNEITADEVVRAAEELIIKNC